MMSEKRILALAIPILFFAIALFFLFDSVRAEANTDAEKQTAVTQLAEINGLNVCTDPPTRIMPMGDSITFGKLSTHHGGYRLPLFLKLRNSGYNITFVGQNMDGPLPPGFDYYHEGNSGKQNANFAQIINRLLTDNTPDIVLTHIGTNDMNQSVEDAETALVNMLDKINTYETNNSVTVEHVLAQIISQACDETAPGCVLRKDNTTDYNNFIGTITETNTTIVNMETGAGLIYEIAPAGDFGDSLHPDDDGYDKMADAWYDALVGILPPPCNTDLLISPADPMFTPASQLFNFQVTASGYPGVTGYALIGTPPAGMTIDSSTGLVSWTPTAGQGGLHEFEVEVTNGEESESQIFSVTVTNTDMEISLTPATKTIVENGSVEFTVTITNTGSDTLNTIDVTFADAPSCDATAGPVTPGNAAQVTCLVSNITADLSFTADVAATSDAAITVSDSANSLITVLQPALTITVTPETQEIDSGDQASFNVSVKNTGEVNLTNVQVSGFPGAACNKTVGALTVNQTKNFSCQITLSSGGTFNIKANGSHVNGTTSGSDSVSVTVNNPEYFIFLPLTLKP